MAMPAFSRRRFQRIAVGPNVMIEVLETGRTIVKIEITAPQGWRILRGERELWKGQTMLRSSEELEQAAAKKLEMTHEQLLERTSPVKLADIRNVEKPTKLIIERVRYEAVKIGPNIYVQVFRAGKTCLMGIECAQGMEIRELDISDDRRATELVRQRTAALRHRQWVENGGPGRLHAARMEKKDTA